MSIIRNLIQESEKIQERENLFENSTFSQEVISDNNQLYDLLTEAAEASIPDKLKKQISKDSVRQEMKDNYGNDAFLLPSEEKFPVINPETGKYDCRLIYAARIRAKQHDYPEVAKKAEKLYNDQGCEEKIDVNIEDHDQSYELLELLEMLDIDFSDIDKE